MIIKSMPRKSSSFGQLLAYIAIPERTGPTVAHNLVSANDDLPSVHQEFRENAGLLPPRKNGNYLYHEVLSFAEQDREQVTPAIAADLATQYLKLRAPAALAYGRGHFETTCPHLHLMISANNAGSTRRLRLSRREFAKVKRELEAYQREHYPFLEHSVVFNRPSQQKLGRKEAEQKRRERKAIAKSPSRKNEVRRLVAAAITSSGSGTEVYRQLQRNRLELYQRGQNIGVQEAGNGRKYRLQTLGLAEMFGQALRQWKEQEGLSQERQKRRRPERGR